MKEKQILDIFGKASAILKGHFKLSSGLHSAGYLQCARVLEYPEYAGKLCAALADRFKAEKPGVVIAPAVGGIIVSYEVARSIGAKSLFTERVDGKMTLRRDFALNEKDKVLIVEDVVTTGLSTKEVIEVVRSYGSKIVGVGCLVDRSSEKIDFGARFEALIKVNVPTFEPASCPLCKDGIPAVKPGSRPTT